jgi:hypothetical protein
MQCCTYWDLRQLQLCFVFSVSDSLVLLEYTVAFNLAVETSFPYLQANWILNHVCFAYIYLYHQVLYIIIVLFECLLIHVEIQVHCHQLQFHLAAFVPLFEVVFSAIYGCNKTLVYPRPSCRICRRLL